MDQRELDELFKPYWDMRARQEQIRRDNEARVSTWSFIVAGLIIVGVLALALIRPAA